MFSVCIDINYRYEEEKEKVCLIWILFYFLNIEMNFDNSDLYSALNRMGKNRKVKIVTD